MSIRNIQKRLRKIEQKLCPPDDGGFTLEELCRSMWDRDKKEFQELANNMGWGFLVTTFEFEDAERRPHITSTPAIATDIAEYQGLTGSSGTAGTTSYSEIIRELRGSAHSCNQHAAAAHLDPTQLQPDQPHWTPPAATDNRFEWTGVSSDRPEIKIRPEAASFHGRPVLIEIFARMRKRPPSIF